MQYLIYLHWCILSTGALWFKFSKSIIQCFEHLREQGTTGSSLLYFRQFLALLLLYSEVVAQLHTHVTYSLAWAECWLFSWCFISWSRGSWCALSIISLVQWPVAAPAECLTNFLLLVFGYFGSWKAANFAGQVLVHQALQLASSCAGSIYSCELQQIADLAGINTSALPAFSPKLQDFMGSIMIYPAAHWAGQKYMDDG